MPIYLFEPDKPMRQVPLLSHTDIAPKSYAYSSLPLSGNSISKFYVFSPRLEKWLEIKPEGVPPEYRAMVLLIPTS